jgi:hypothetical protein
MKGRKIKSPEFKLQAGQMFVDNGRVKPNPNKGELRFSINRDDLLVFEWKDLETNIVSEPLVIFDGEWEWVKKGTQKGRVYCLQSTTFGEKFYYWMQYKNPEEDPINENIISNILKTGKLELNEEKEDKDTINNIENIVNTEQEGAKQTNGDTTKQAANMNNAEFIKSFTKSLRGGANKKSNLIIIKLSG